MTEVYNVVQPGQGTTLGYCTTSGGTFTSVAQIKDISGIEPTVTMWDSTGLGSTAAEQVPTIVKSGEIGFKVVFNPSDATHIALAGYLNTMTLLYWKLTYPNPIGPGATAPETPHTASWCGYLSGAALTGFETQDGVERDFKISVSGVITES